MAGRHQKSRIMNAPPPGWEKQFAYLGRADKLTCLTCGTKGYPALSGRPAPWQAGCLIGHPETCATCGARFVKGGVAKHRECKSGHGCPDHAGTQHGRLQSLRATP